MNAFADRLDRKRPVTNRALHERAQHEWGVGRLVGDEGDVGEGGHLAVEGEGVDAGKGVVVGDEAVEEAGAAGGREGLEDGVAAERGDEAAGEGGVEAGAGVGAGKVVVVDEGRVGFANGLIGREHLASPFVDQIAQPVETALEVRFRLPHNQSDED